MSAVREQIAALIHKQWAGQIGYVFAIAIKNVDGSLTIPAEHVAYWRTTAHTSYTDLPDMEKDIARDDADSVLRILGLLDGE